MNVLLTYIRRVTGVQYNVSELSFYNYDPLIVTLEVLIGTITDQHDSIIEIV